MYSSSCSLNLIPLDLQQKKNLYTDISKVVFSYSGKSVCAKKLISSNAKRICYWLQEKFESFALSTFARVEKDHSADTDVTG